MATQDNDLPSENVQDLEKPPKGCSEDEGNQERNLTESLVEISEKAFDDEHKSSECFIRTGWEEAVCGWGAVSASACLYPQKKSKKLKQGASPDCLLCLDTYVLPESKNQSPETKCTRHSDKQGKPVTERSHAETHLPPAGEDLDAEVTDHCPYITATVSRTQACCDNDSPAQVSISEQRERNSQSCSSRLIARAIPICTNSYNTKESQPFTSPVSLPPLKAPAANGFTEQLMRRRAFLIQQLDKIPSAQVINNTDIRADRRLVNIRSELPKEKLKVPESLSFITSCMPRAHLENAERFQWQSSFLGQKSNSAKQSSSPASVGFLHTRTMQSQRNVQQDLRPSNDLKYRSPKSATSPLMRNTILPSLTVKRVEIPVKVKLC
ncbi:uncharacterized protein C16orf46 homolog isoform X2 [Pseudophryne corroboree]|uniref:uncharacterized protein C16orf46 homolog isoform X2 n=1 Tax=Pseudophryne corroboree TaxID=495146 RepID=UPI00308185D0